MSHPGRRVSRGAERGAVALLFAVATTLLTWPLASRLGTAVVDPGDPLLHAWTLSWTLHALATAPARLFDANIFYPHRWTLAYSDHLLGLLPLAAPVTLAGGGPVLAHNVVLFSTFPLTGLAMFWLVRELTGRAGAGLVAGIVYAFSPYRFAHLSQVQLLSHFWLPVLLLGLHRTVAAGGRWRDLALASAAFVGQALASGYYMYFAAVAAVVFAVWTAAAPARPPLARIVRRGAVSAVAAAVLLLPALLPYYVVRHELGLRRPLEEVRYDSAHPDSYLMVPATLRGWRLLGWQAMGDEWALFPGGLTLLLAAVGALGALTAAAARDPTPGSVPAQSRGLRWLDRIVALALVLALLDVLVLGGAGVRLGLLRLSHRSAWEPPVFLALVLVGLGARRLADRRRVPLPGLGWLRGLAWPHPGGLYLGLTAVGVLLSFGPTLVLGGVTVAHPLYGLLYRLLPGFDGLRTPARWGLLALTGLAVLAGYGVATLVQNRSGPACHAIAGCLAAVGLLEAFAAPIPFDAAPAPTAADRWLAAAPPGPVVVLPLHPVSDAHRETVRLLGSTVHWQPLVNGYSGFFPPDYRETLASLSDFPASEAMARLRELGVRHVVIEHELLDDVRRARMQEAVLRPPAGVAIVATFEDVTILEVTGAAR